MTTNFQQVRSIFMAALERPADALDSYLAEACGQDAALREQVQILLQAHRSGRGILDEGRDARETVARPSAERAGTVIAGRYKLMERIGEGGMGSVWLAQQSEPIKRKVAVKLIKLGMDSRQVLSRFQAERQALAMMDHPNIAKVLDGGLAADGRPFFVMELVKGTPITEYCDACKLSLGQRLDLFIPVCQAIQHAHQKGIIHRDIKPSNVMIALYDDRPVPKVIDFGVAKATGQALTNATLNTGFGGVIGTPQYMSPEQATLNNLDIDTRSDVYSLGVLLYELLTGTPPFTREELEKKGVMEMLRVVREDEPPKPSTRLSTAAALPMLSANRSIDPGKLTQMLRSDLDWIVLKALEKNRARRYETANGLAADVRRYLSGEPVAAHPPSAAYLMKKFVRRHRANVVAAALVLATLLAGIGGTTFGLIRAKRSAEAERRAGQDADNKRIEAEAQKSRAEAGEKLATERLAQVAAERDAKEEARKDAETISRFLVDVFQSPDPKRDGRTIKVVELLDNAAKKLEADLAAQPAKRTELQATLGETYDALGLARQAIPLQEQVLAFRRKVNGREHADTLGAMHSLAISYFHAGRRDEATKMQEEELSLSRKMCGLEHFNTIRAMHNLALFYFDVGRRDEALKTWEEVLALSRKVNGPEHATTVSAMNNLALSYANAGRQDEALKMREEVLTLSRKVNGPEHPDTLFAMGNLAKSYFAAGRRDEALKMLEEVLALSRKVNGPEHPNTLTAMNNLAAYYFLAGRRDEALKMREEMLALNRKVNGPEHPDTLDAMRWVAFSYFQAGRGDEALKMREEALALSRKVNGPEHPDTLWAMNGLAVSYFNASRRDEALKMREEVLALSRKVNGPEHPDTLAAMNGLAGSYFDVGRRDEALKMQEEVLALSRKVNGPEYPDTLGVMRNLADDYFKAGRRDEALKMRQELLALSRRVNGPEHPDTIWAMHGLAESYFDVGRRDEALKMREELLALNRKLNGPEHPDTLWAMNDLAESYLYAGRRDEALKMREELLALSRKVNGPEHLNTLSAMNILAAYYFDVGRRDEAFKMQVEVLALRRKVNGPEHPATISTMSDLAIFYANAGRQDEALKMREDVLALRRKVFGPEHPDTLRLLADLSETYLSMAANQAWFGQEDALGGTCDKMLELAKDAKNAELADRASKACSLRKSDPRRHAAALVLARRAVEMGKGNPNLPYFQMALGMAEYRSGHYAQADAALLAAERGAKADRCVPGTSAFYRAMSLFQQGKRAEALALFAATEAIMGPFPADEKDPLAGKGSSHDDLILWMACKEARVLLKGPSDAPKK